jgi:DNA-binding Lrp family transcriptional regulator
MTFLNSRVDDVDRQLLAALQKDGRATVGELAELVSLSQSPCWRRVRQLEDSGVIAGYHARLDRKLLGYGVLGFVHLAMHDHTLEKADAFEREVAALPQVLSCHNLSGRFDYQLEVVAQDLEGFAEFVRNNIRGLPGVREISTSFSLKEVKRFVEVPVPVPVN